MNVNFSLEFAEFRLEFGTELALSFPMEVQMIVQSNAITGKDTLLKERVLRFANLGEGWQEIRESLSWSIYMYPLKKGVREEDDPGDFYVYFLPRLKRLLRRYRDQGRPFEHYFNSLLRWHLKSFYRHSRRFRENWNIAVSRDFWDVPEDTEAVIQLFDDESDGRWIRLLGIGEDGRIHNEAAKKRFLFLVMRCVRNLNDRRIEIAARIAGCCRCWLKERVQRLMELVRDKEHRLEMFWNRRNRAYYRLRVLERRLSWEQEEEKKIRLLSSIQRQKRIMALSMDEARRVPLSPSHRAIALALGVPKGTVDTGLRWIKKRLESLSSRRALYPSRSTGVSLVHGDTAGNNKPT